MFKHKRSQSGFGIVEALCFIVMFSMVGLIGWYVINENQNSQETLDNIGGAEVQTSSSKPATAGDKFVFKELGVQIALPDNLKGLKYVQNRDNSYLTSDNFKEVLDSCNGDTGAGFGDSFAAINKVAGQYPSNPTVDDGQLLKQFSSFYIGMGVPNGLSCGEDTAKGKQIQSKATELQKTLVNAFKTATQVE